MGHPQIVQAIVLIQCSVNHTCIQVSSALCKECLQADIQMYVYFFIV